MEQYQRNARLAGFLYMLVAITGPFILIYVPGKLFVTRNAAATAANILENESLYRAYIAVGLVSELFFIATVLALYRLLKDVGHQLAVLMVILVLVDAPLAFVGAANQFATLSFLQGSDLLVAFDKPQREALATMLIALNQLGIPVSELFWGLWLFPLATLVYRSGFFPRFLGVWLLFNGIAYVATSFVAILLPEHLKTVSSASLPILFGELVFALWLVIVGAKERPVVAQDIAPG